MALVYPKHYVELANILNMESSISRSDLCDRFAKLYTGAVTDVLDEHGFHNQTIRDGIEPLDPSLTTAGIAYPALGRRNIDVDPQVQIRDHLRMVGEAPEDAMLAIEANDGISAQIGELITTSLSEHGGRGIILDGGTRDTSHILEQGFPVFTGYQTPEDSVPRWELLDWNCEVTLGGVRITPGDVIMGDRDGVVVIPESEAEAVLHDAERRYEAEGTVREAILDGMTPLEAYERFEVF